jgi:hypothetical protein
MKNLKEFTKHKKLLDEIKHLSWRIKGVKSLQIHQIYTAQNDTLINLLKGEAEGRLKLDNYEDYKGYMFMTIRSQINKQFKIMTYKYNSLTSSGQQLAEHQGINFDEYISNQGKHNYQPEIGELRDKLNGFSSRDRAIIRWRMRGWKFREIAEAFGICQNTMINRYYRLVSQLK